MDFETDAVKCMVEMVKAIMEKRGKSFNTHLQILRRSRL